MGRSFRFRLPPALSRGAGPYLDLGCPRPPVHGLWTFPSALRQAGSAADCPCRLLFRPSRSGFRLTLWCNRVVWVFQQFSGIPSACRHAVAPLTEGCVHHQCAVHEHRVAVVTHRSRGGDGRCRRPLHISVQARPYLRPSGASRTWSVNLHRRQVPVGARLLITPAAQFSSRRARAFAPRCGLGR